jgi:hypothetical protein
MSDMLAAPEQDSNGRQICGQFGKANASRHAGRHREPLEPHGGQ